MLKVHPSYPTANIETGELVSFEHFTQQCQQLKFVQLVNFNIDLNPIADFLQAVASRKKYCFYFLLWNNISG